MVHKKKYRQGFYPQLELIEVENGLEEKIGGLVPFFEKNSTWPTALHVPLMFIAQFVDPSSYHKNELIQIWMANIEEEDSMLSKLDPDHAFEYFDSGDGYPAFKIIKIALDNVSESNQLIIEPPKYAYPKKEGLYREPMRIVDWTPRMDLDICGYYDGLTPEECKSVDGYSEELNPFIPESYKKSPLKVGGYGISVQCQTYEMFIQDLFHDRFGDCGTIHIGYEDGKYKIHGDMC
jgi:hypothetical protein